MARPVVAPSVAGDATEDTVPERRTIVDVAGRGAVALPGTMAESRGADVPTGAAAAGSSAPTSSSDEASDAPPARARPAPIVRRRAAGRGSARR
ncbi:hypothetical protein [Actinomycetospora sp. CA-053990]|uniref:hypothetical protein n=1 Tax=Actinomycetospora sp. CA-053990 TaxID=3239891 RepID=UPI003D8F793F